MILGCVSSSIITRSQNTFNLSYHELVSVSGAEARNATLKEMVGAASSGYPRDKIGACSSGDGEVDENRGI